MRVTTILAAGMAAIALAASPVMAGGNGNGHWSGGVEGSILSKSASGSMAATSIGDGNQRIVNESRAGHFSGASGTLKQKNGTFTVTGETVSEGYTFSRTNSVGDNTFGGAGAIEGGGAFVSGGFGGTLGRGFGRN